MACSSLGSSVHGIFQARTLEWVAFPFSRGSSPPREGTWVSCTAGRFFTVWATKKAYGEAKSKYPIISVPAWIPAEKDMRTHLVMPSAYVHHHYPTSGGTVRSTMSGLCHECLFSAILFKMGSMQVLHNTFSWRASSLSLFCMCALLRPHAAAPQAPLSLDFSNQEYWSRLPFPLPEDFPYLGIKPRSPASPALAGQFFNIEPPGKSSLFLT